MFKPFEWMIKKVSQKNKFKLKYFSSSLINIFKISILKKFQLDFGKAFFLNLNYY